MNLLKTLFSDPYVCVFMIIVNLGYGLTLPDPHGANKWYMLFAGYFIGRLYGNHVVKCITNVQLLTRFH